MAGKIPYALTRATVSVSISMTLTDCVTTTDNTGKWLNLQADITATPTISSEADPDYQFYVPYKPGAGFWKESNIKIGTTNKALQSVDVVMNDQTGPTMVAAAQTAAKIFGASRIPVLGAAAHTGENDPDQELCAHKPAGDTSKQIFAKEALAKIKELSDAIKVQKDLETATSKAAFPDPAKTKVPAPTPAEVTFILNNAATIIAADQAESDKAKKDGKLVRTLTYKWTPDPARDTITYDGDFAIIAKQVDITDMLSPWLSPAGQAWLKAAKFADAKTPEEVKAAEELQKVEHPVTLSIVLNRKWLGLHPDGFNKEFQDDDRVARTLDNPHGLVVRDPAIGVLVICHEACARMADLMDTSNEMAARTAIAVPQFGRILVLPERSGLFQNAELTLTLNADGSIATIGYHNLSTFAGLMGLGGIGQTADAVAAGAGQRNTGIAAENTALGAQAQLPDNYNKALADCLASAAAVVKAGGKPVACQ